MAVVVFKSKSDVFAFIERARHFGLGASVVSTPREIKIGCGLSAKIGKSHITLAKKVLFSYDFSSFYGIFTIQKVFGTTTLKKIL